MSWLWLAVLIIVALLALRYLGKLIAGVIGLVVLGVVGLYAYQEWQRSSTSKHISAAEIEVSELSLTGSTRGPREVVGRIHNKSARYTLKEAEIEIQLKDCVAKQCDIVNAESFTLRKEIPAGQSREFRQPVFIQTPAQPRGEQQLGYQVLRTRGE